MSTADGSSARASTIEAEVRRQLLARLGGPRAAIESAVPLALFTLAYVVGGRLGPAAALSLAVVVVVLLIHLVRREPVRPALQGAAGIGVGVLLASATGEAENVFLPGILTAAGWTVVLGGSMLVGRPLAGYLIAELVGRRRWRHDPAIVRLGWRLTAVLVAPMVLRLFVEVPLYLNGSVAGLGIARIVLGWPLHAVTLALAGVVLARGRTPLDTGG